MNVYMKLAINTCLQNVVTYQLRHVLVARTECADLEFVLWHMQAYGQAQSAPHGHPRLLLSPLRGQPLATQWDP